MSDLLDFYFEMAKTTKRLYHHDDYEKKVRGKYAFLREQRDKHPTLSSYGLLMEARIYQKIQKPVSEKHQPNQVLWHLEEGKEDRLDIVHPRPKEGRHALRGTNSKATS